VDLKTFYINPTIAWRANDQLAVGVGLQAVYSSVHLERFNVMFDPNGGGYFNVAAIDLEGNSVIDMGANVGVKYTPTSDIAIGAHYRSKVTGKMEGDAKFEQVMTGTPIDDVVPSLLPPDQGVALDVVFPWLLSVGGAYYGVEKWVFEVDFNYFGWKDFEELTFRFDDPALDSTRPQNWDNTLSIRTGTQYTYNEVIDLRGGYYFDPTPQPIEAMSPFLGDADRHGISLGLGLHHSTMTIDVFALFLLTSERSTEGTSHDAYNGTYLAFGNLFGLNLGFEF
jgi:long-chain fatty acid transport protein